MDMVLTKGMIAVGQKFGCNHLKTKHPILDGLKELMSTRWWRKRGGGGGGEVLGGRSRI